MKIKSWFLSLMLPVLSIVASIVFLFFGCAILFNIAFGFLTGGLVPLLIVAKKKVDISQFFVGKIILSGVWVIVIILSWYFLYDWYFEDIYRVFILPIVALILEIVFAMTRKADSEQKICLFLSSLIHVYVGGLVDFLIIFSPLFWG